MNKEIALQMQGITKYFGPVAANRGVDLTVYRGEIMAILGENGCGKTTQIKMLKKKIAANGGYAFMTGEPTCKSSHTPTRAGAMLANVLKGKTKIPASAIAGLFLTDRILHNTDASLGINKFLNEGADGVFSTTRISNVGFGVKNLGVSNEFRNVSAFAGTVNGASYAFYEAGDNDVFNFCTAENFACGYYLKDKVKSVIEASSILWTSASVTKQTAFEADGVFNAILVGCKIRFFDATSENSCIKYKAIGSGALRTPIFDETLCDDASYKNVLAGTVVTVK